jgi:hypothetical protein
MKTCLLSIANINVGDEISIPGGDNFQKPLPNCGDRIIFPMLRSSSPNWKEKILT